MSFKSYALQVLPDGSLLLDDPQPLVFSGREGLIARLVLGPGNRARGHWRLRAGELHTLATPGLQLRERLIVFEQVEDAKRELLALDAINGVSGECTEMMFSFRPLLLMSSVPHLEVRFAPGGKIYSEELSLDGGTLAPAGSWRWRRPHLAIGGVVVGARAMR